MLIKNKENIGQPQIRNSLLTIKQKRQSIFKFKFDSFENLSEIQKNDKVLTKQNQKILAEKQNNIQFKNRSTCKQSLQQKINSLGIKIFANKINLEQRFKYFPVTNYDTKDQIQILKKQVEYLESDFDAEGEKINNTVYRKFPKREELISSTIQTEDLNIQQMQNNFMKQKAAIPYYQTNRNKFKKLRTYSSKNTQKSNESLLVTTLNPELYFNEIILNVRPLSSTINTLQPKQNKKVIEKVKRNPTIAFNSNLKTKEQTSLPFNLRKYSKIKRSKRNSKNTIYQPCELPEKKYMNKKSQKTYIDDFLKIKYPEMY